MYVIIKHIKTESKKRVPVILSLTGPSLLYEVFHYLKLSHKKYVLCQHIAGNNGPSSDNKYYKEREDFTWAIRSSVLPLILIKFLILCLLESN